MKSVLELKTVHEFVEKLESIKDNADLITACVVGVMGVDDEIKFYFAGDRSVDLGGLMFLLNVHIGNQLLADTEDDDDNGIC